MIFSLLNKFINSSVAPVWKVENRVTQAFSAGVIFFNSQKSLVAENMMLKERIHSLETELFVLSVEQKREDTFLELLGRKGESNKIIATVLTRPPQTPYDVITIDVGSNESITTGSKISMPEGSLLGTVSAVFSKSAQVKLFSSSGEETNAVLERNNVPITLVGLGSGNFRFELPRDIVIEVGDRILSSDVGTRHLATVGEVNIRPTDSFKEILAKSPINIFTLRFIFIEP
ncbi:MAG: rod shape-determining protein MreC [Patescibacteria group bacterium]